MSQPIFLKQGTLRDAADSADDQVSAFKMQLDNSMEHNKTLLTIIENLARCATLIAQDNQYLNEQASALQQETARLDREIRNIMQRNEELEKRCKTNAVAIK